MLTRAERDARKVVEPERASSIAGTFALAFEEIAATQNRIVWPSPKYRKDPVGFARDIFGLELWSKQRDIANAVVRHRKTSVVSGHRVGKSQVAAVIALWFYCSFPKARVFIVGPTLLQVEDVVWREITILVRERAGTCLDCRRAAELLNPELPEYPRPCPHSALVDGVLHDHAADGLVSDDHREIHGHTATDPTALQGRASPHLLYVVDEASGVKDDTLRVVQSNLAAEGARALYISNPTKTSGIFYESQTSARDQYHCVHVSSLEVVDLGIPGLASRAWTEETAALNGGYDSAEYLIRVLGQFPRESAKKVIPRSIIDDAVAAWATTPAEGPLHLGVDVARYGDDDTAIAVRRGSKILELVRRNGLGEKQVAALVLETADRFREAREIVTIKVDAAGVGSPVVIELNLRRSRFHHVVALHPGSSPSRLPDEYAYLRDQLWFSCAQWLREGGAIPDDERLAAELHQPSYGYDARNRRKVESKDNTRKELKRSPDGADAVCLAVFDEGALAQAPTPMPRAPAVPIHPASSGAFGASSRALIYGRRR